MSKKILSLFLSLTIIALADSAPVKFDTLEFDNLDADISDLKYEVEEEDLDDFSKMLDDNDINSNTKENSKTATNSNSSGNKKSKSDRAGIKGKFNISDLKKIFKVANGHDAGKYDDADLFAYAKGIAAAALGTGGTENRTYKKGTKTRGFHRVQHKDEYKKDQEFYEDDETKGTINKFGIKAIGAKAGAGVDFNKGYFHHDRQKGIQAKQGFLDKGALDAEINKYSDSQNLEGLF